VGYFVPINTPELSLNHRRSGVKRESDKAFDNQILALILALNKHLYFVVVKKLGLSLLLFFKNHECFFQLKS